MTGPEGSGRSLWQQFVETVRFWDIARAESKRTVYCHPDDVERVTRTIREAGAEEAFTVRASPAAKAGQVLVVDEQALEAGLREAMQRPFRFGTEETP